MTRHVKISFDELEEDIEIIKELNVILENFIGVQTLLDNLDTLDKVQKLLLELNACKKTGIKKHE